MIHFRIKPKQTPLIFYKFLLRILSGKMLDMILLAKIQNILKY